MELGSRPSAAALGRPIPFLGGWPAQLVVATTGRPLAFGFVLFFSVTIGWPEQPSGRLLPFFIFFCNVCRASISRHNNFLMDFEDFEILCRAPKLTHGRAVPCVTIKSARQSAFTVQFAVVRSFPCVFEKNARQNLCHAFYRLCRAPRTHGNPSYSRSESS
jgi:hypothetical protein